MQRLPKSLRWRKRRKQRDLARVQAGLCCDCLAPHGRGTWFCATCAAKRVQANRDWRKKSVQ